MFCLFFGILRAIWGAWHLKRRCSGDTRDIWWFEMARHWNIIKYTHLSFWNSFATWNLWHFEEICITRILVCDEEQTIAHLLFECEYLSGLWERVSQAIDYDIVCDYIMCGSFDGNCQSNNIVITLVSFLIYKDWLLHSLDNKKRPTLFNMEQFKSELQLRIKIYEKCNMIVHVNQIINLLSFL